MVKKLITVELSSGLEARPAAMLVQVASQYESKIYLEAEAKRVNAKSIMGMMTLCLTAGEAITVVAEGDDEEQAVSEIVEFRPADLTAANHFYALDIRRMNGEHPFNADIVAYSADRERLGQAAALSGDNRTLKDLDALLGALLDADVYRDGVADAEIRNVRLELRLIEFFNGSHFSPPLISAHS